MSPAPQVEEEVGSPIAPEEGATTDLGAVLRRLSRIDLLRALPPEEVQAIAPWVHHESHGAGARIIEQGAGGDAMYFIESGIARVTRDAQTQSWDVGAGSVVGETALLTGEPRSATVTAQTEVSLWRVDKAAFDKLVAESPNLRSALERLVRERKAGVKSAMPSAPFWAATAIRALDAHKSLHGWQVWMAVGLLLWVVVAVAGATEAAWLAWMGSYVAGVELIAGLLILQGACEAFITGVERLGARLHWEGFISGTVGSLLSTLPEFVVIAFLVRVDPLAAVVTAIVTIFNNALAFSIYGFFLPKDRKGVFAMPRSLTVAGGEIMIAGAAIALTVGIVMIVHQLGEGKTALVGVDLIAIAVVMFAIYGYYVHSLLKYYAEGQDAAESHPPEPSKLGHRTSWAAIGTMFALGLIGAYAGGESVGGFAEIALGRMGLPTIPTAAALAFFAGSSEYIIVWKSHRRGELGIALSNVFGGMSQVMFLLFPFTLLVIGIMGLTTGGAAFVLPISSATLLLVLLLFPLFYALHQFVELEQNLSDLDAAAMTGIYLLLLYFLFTAPS